MNLEETILSMSNEEAEWLLYLTRGDLFYDALDRRGREEQ